MFDRRNIIRSGWDVGCANLNGDTKMRKIKFKVRCIYHSGIMRTPSSAQKHLKEHHSIKLSRRETVRAGIIGMYGLRPLF